MKRRYSASLTWNVDSRLVEEPSYLADGPLAPVQAAAELLIGLLPDAFGFLTGAMGFYLTRYLADRFATRGQHFPSLSLWHVLIAAVAFPLIWEVEIFAVWSLTSFNTTLVFIALLIPLGLFARFYIRRSRNLAEHIGGRIASRMKMDAVLRVRETRNELVDLMDTIRSRYLEEVFGPATGYPGPSAPTRKS